MIFVDTTVLVAASTPSDLHHEDCLDLLASVELGGVACATHTLAEMFSIMSGRPLPLRLPPSDAANLIEHTAKRMTLVSLTPEEYLATVQGMAKLGHSGGMIYDALILACARKIDAHAIYTHNVRHFRQIAPDLEDRIRIP